MGEARRRMLANGGMILEPRGMAPVQHDKTIDLKVGVARDALKVAIQAGDILMHCSAQAARETAGALLAMADTVDALTAQRDGKIITA